MCVLRAPLPGSRVVSGVWRVMRAVPARRKFGATYVEQSPSTTNHHMTSVKKVSVCKSPPVSAPPRAHVRSSQRNQEGTVRNER